MLNKESKLLFYIVIVLTILDLIIALFIDYLYSIDNIEYKIILFIISLLPFLFSIIFLLFFNLIIKDNTKVTIFFIIRILFVLPIILFFILIMFFSVILDGNIEDISNKKILNISSIIKKS